MAESTNTEEWVDLPLETPQRLQIADPAPVPELDARRLKILTGETRLTPAPSCDLTTGSVSHRRAYMLRSIQVAVASRLLYLAHGWYVVRARVHGLSWGEDPQAELAIGVRVVGETSLESLPATGWQVIENWLGWTPPRDPTTPIRDHRAGLLQDYGAAAAVESQFDLCQT